MMKRIASKIIPTPAVHLTESFLPPKRASAVMRPVMAEITYPAIGA